MGRGRAKAKQTKVARELKYSSHSTDFDALQRELSQDGGPPSVGPPPLDHEQPDRLSDFDDEFEDSDEDEDEDRRAWN